MSALTERFEKLLAQGQDTAILRFSLGNAWLAEDPARAALHFARATELDPMYSAAWKMLGKACAAQGDTAGAIGAYTRGIEVAEARGDIQTAREMRVFLKRLSTSQAPDSAH